MQTIEDRSPMYFLLKLEFRICIRIIHPFQSIFCNGNKNERSPIRSVIIRVLKKSDDHAAEVRFVYHDFTTRSLKTFLPMCTDVAE